MNQNTNIGKPAIYGGDAAPTPEGEVSSQCSGIENEIRRLTEQIERLASVTQAVRREYPAAPPTNGVNKPVPVLVPLAERLNGSQERLMAINAHLESLINGIQI